MLVGNHCGPHEALETICLFNSLLCIKAAEVPPSTRANQSRIVFCPELQTQKYLLTPCMLLRCRRPSQEFLTTNGCDRASEIWAFFKSTLNGLWAELCCAQPSALSLPGWKEASRAAAAPLPPEPANPGSVGHGCPLLLAAVLEALPAPVPSHTRLLHCPGRLYPSAGTAGPCVPAGQEQVTSTLSQPVLSGWGTRLAVGVRLEADK